LNRVRHHERPRWPGWFMLAKTDARTARSDRVGYTPWPLGWNWPILFALTIGGFSLILGATRPGIGIQADSVAYIQSARALASGRGFGASLMVWPPFYSMVLALPIAAGVEALAAARYLGAILFGCNVALLASIVQRCLRGGFWPVLFAGLLALTSTDMLMIHSHALSEPLFLFCTLGGLIYIAEGLAADSLLRVLLGSCFWGLAWATRYAGVATIAAGFLVLLIAPGRPFSRRLQAIVIYGCGTCLPILLWFARNIVNNPARGIGVGRELAWHPMGPEHMGRLWASISAWFLPASSPAGLQNVVLPLLLLAIAGGSWWVLGRGRSVRPVFLDRRGQFLQGLSAWMVVFYMGLLVITIVFVDARVSFERRLLTLFFVLLVPLATVHAARIYRNASLWGRIVVGAACIFLVGFESVRAAAWYHVWSRDGQGYASRSWKQSPLLASLKAIAQQRPVWSNAPAAIASLTDRPAMGLPREYDAFTAAANAGLAGEIDQMRRSVQAGGILVWFSKVGTGDIYLPLAGLRQQIPLRCIATEEDGQIFQSATAGGVTQP